MRSIDKFRHILPSRGLAVGLAAGFMLSLSLATWANHDPIDPETQTVFADDDIISAAPFNEMFAELYGWAEGTDMHIEDQDAQIAALEAQIAALEAQQATLLDQFNNLHASPCGETAPVDGSFGGYAGGKALCAMVNACSPTAHMCSTGELLRYFNSGGNFNGYNDGWVSSGVMSYSTDFGYVNDCSGWTSTQYSGSYWHSSGRPSFSACTILRPITCCD